MKSNKNRLNAEFPRLKKVYMKKILILGTIALAVAGLFLFVFFPQFKVAGQSFLLDFLFANDEPDLPAFLDKAKSKFSKEEFMTGRAEHIALKRGIDKDKPRPDPRIRQ
ncbi:MAG TPA: hypothetical protein VNA17_08840, partial [Pyrinomonadaceae bacterium]|nr:hypothetical protein [Pyrinomonadaceae bacterium]